MSALSAKDRASLCTFTFADGRRCRTPRQSGHPFYCCFHARKQAQAQATEELGRDFAYLFSGDYLSACDLTAVLGRLFAAVARGEIKPRTAATLAYLAQTLLQTMQVAEHEFTSAFGQDVWLNTVSSHVKENYKYLSQRFSKNAVQPLPPIVPQFSQPAVLPEPSVLLDAAPDPSRPPVPSAALSDPPPSQPASASSSTCGLEPASSPPVRSAGFIAGSSSTGSATEPAAAATAQVIDEPSQPSSSGSGPTPTPSRTPLSSASLTQAPAQPATSPSPTFPGQPPGGAPGFVSLAGPHRRSFRKRTE